MELDNTIRARMKTSRGVPFPPLSVEDLKNEPHIFDVMAKKKYGKIFHALTKIEQTELVAEIRGWKNVK